MKAILVVDMPSDCNHCQFADFSNGQWECNQTKERVAKYMKTFSVSSKCPLKPMPDRVAKELILFAEKWANYFEVEKILGEQNGDI